MKMIDQMKELWWGGGPKQKSTTGHTSYSDRNSLCRLYRIQPVYTYLESITTFSFSFLVGKDRYIFINNRKGYNEEKSVIV